MNKKIFLSNMCISNKYKFINKKSIEYEREYFKSIGRKKTRVGDNT